MLDAGNLNLEDPGSVTTAQLLQYAAYLVRVIGANYTIAESTDAFHEIDEVRRYYGQQSMLAFALPDGRFVAASSAIDSTPLIQICDNTASSGSASTETYRTEATYDAAIYPVPYGMHISEDSSRSSLDQTWYTGTATSDSWITGQNGTEAFSWSPFGGETVNGTFRPNVSLNCSERQ